MKMFKRALIVLITLLLLLCLGYIAAWYYITGKITSGINEFIAEKSAGIDNGYIDKLYQGGGNFKQDEKYFQSAKLARVEFGDFAALNLRKAKARAYGFPFTIGVAIEGVEEEWSAARVYLQYQQPICLSYNLFSQNLTLNYSGKAKMSFHKGANGKVVDFFDLSDLNYEIDAIKKHGKYKHMPVIEPSAKPVMLSIDDFKLILQVPLSGHLFDDLSKKHYGSIFNHVNELHGNCAEMKYTDIDNKEVYYLVTDSTVSFEFSPRQDYKTMEDVFSNIPGQWQLELKTKRTINAAAKKHNLIQKWHGGDSFIKVNLANDARSFKEITTDKFTFDAIIKHSFKLLDIDISQLTVKQTKQSEGGYKRDITINSNMLPRSGFIKSMLQDKELHKLLNDFTADENKKLRHAQMLKNIDFLIDNYDSLKLYEIENSHFVFNCDINTILDNRSIQAKVNSLEALSEGAGFALNGKAENENVSGNNSLYKDITASGDLTVVNYNRVVDNLAMFFYHHSRMPKKLLKKIWPTYLKANTLFFRSIASNYKEKGPNLVYKFDIDTKPPYKAIFGQVNLREFDKTYEKFITNKALNGIFNVEELNELRDFIKNKPKTLQDAPQEVKKLLEQVKNNRKFNPVIKKGKEELLKKLF